jgi:hypothetical protein
MFGKAIKNIGRGIPALVKPTPRKPAPVNSGLVSKEDPFFKSKEYKSFEEQQRGRPATMDMYNSPYFGSVGSGSFGRAQDEAYRKFKNIPDPTPPRLGTQPPAGGVGTTGFKSGFGGLDSGMLRGGRAGGLGAGFGGGAGMAKMPLGAMPKMSSALAALGQKPLGMKKGGKVKSASARADGCAVRGKTRA